MPAILSVVLFVLYLLLFSFIITRPRFVSWSGLSRVQLLLIFALKIISGIAYGLVAEYYYKHTTNLHDTLRFQRFSLVELEILKRSPSEFFSGLENNYPHGYKGFLSSYNSWWNDIHDTVFIKFLTLVNLVSGGYYYVNVIFFAFIFLVATILIYRIFADSFPGSKKEVLIGCFLIPSVLFWTSGIHKDGMVLVGMALVIANFYHVLKNNKATIRNILLILAGLIILLLLRNFILVLLVPALVVWTISHFIRRGPLKVYLVSYALFGIFFFLSGMIDEKLDLPKAVARKQFEFLVLKGNSEIPVKNLEPTATGFLKSFPKAAELVLFQPLPNRITNNFVIPASVEVMLLSVSLLLFIFFHRSRRLTPFILFCVFFGITYLLSVGYTVNIVGAIVRYRSLAYPFLITPMLAFTDWARIRAFFTKERRINSNI